MKILNADRLRVLKQKISVDINEKVSEMFSWMEEARL